MKQLTMKEILDTKDFEEAKIRYEKCHSNRWKNQWWDVLCTIWKKTRKFTKKYILDPVNKVILKIGELVDSISFTYWITLVNEKGERVWEKIGKSDDPFFRWNEILKSKYCSQWGVVNYRVNKVWKRVNQPGEGLESYLRAMLIKDHPREYVPTDRFCCDLTMEEVTKYAREYGAE